VCTTTPALKCFKDRKQNEKTQQIIGNSQMKKLKLSNKIIKIMMFLTVN
jgi:hypothetical protein